MSDQTCEVCRGNSGPYRRHANPHECIAKLEGALEDMTMAWKRMRDNRDMFRKLVMEGLEAMRENGAAIECPRENGDETAVCAVCAWIAKAEALEASR